MTTSNTANTSPVMSVFDPISRLLAFFKRHGFRATLRRFATSMRKLFSPNRMVLFYYDFSRDAGSPPTASLPAHLEVGRKATREEIAPQDWQKILNFWNPAVYQRNCSDRFQQGASLWLIWSEGNLAGYGWTMTGHTIAPHYYPLGVDDVHLFDFLVFPEFRGRNINPCLVEHIIDQLAADSKARAYIEVGEWNQAQLASLRKTRFETLGIARKRSFLGRTFVEWTNYGRIPSVPTEKNESASQSRLRAQ